MSQILSSDFRRKPAIALALVLVSTAVEVETLVMRDFRYSSGIAKYGLVAIRGFLSTPSLYQGLVLPGLIDPRSTTRELRFTPFLLLGPLRAAEQSQPRRGDVGEHCLSFVCACSTSTGRPPDIVSRDGKCARAAQPPRLGEQRRNTATSS